VKAAPSSGKPKSAPASAQKTSGRKLGGGRVGWHDLMTTDLERAHGFYTQLLPWKTKPMEMPPLGMTRRVEAAGAALGGLVSLPASEGIGSHWMPYVVVKDLDAVVRKAKELGGYVPVPPTPLEKVGRFAVIADPRGAHVSPLQMNASNGNGEAQPATGQVCWNEVMTDDVETTAGFFADVFGWDRSTMDMGDGKYTVFMDGAAQRAGAFANPGAPPQWVVYFLVDKIDALFGRAQTLGAEVVEPVKPIPGMGRTAMMKDPTGALFGLFESAR
jgi:predicted enzyme related to lactoylglutathione lyase